MAVIIAGDHIKVFQAQPIFIAVITVQPQGCDPLIGGQFQSNWNELSLGDLFDRIRVSMPLNAPGTLERKETADIVAYVLAKDKYPAGTNELPSQTEMLNSIKYLATKP